jgi:hypothetical protein
MGFLNGLFGSKNCNKGMVESEMNGDSLLFFFLLLIIIFCNSGCFEENGDSLLFFFLLLVVLFCNNCGSASNEGTC